MSTMSHVDLSVTRKMLEYATDERVTERQISVSSPSSDIRDRVFAVTAANTGVLRLGGLISLVLGSRSTIARAHNLANAEAFDALYDLLATRAGCQMRFLCELRDQ